VIRATLALLLALALPLLAGGTARADSDGPSPRVTVVIGGVSVVLVAADGKMIAFVDRIADNAPASDAELVVTPIGGKPLPLSRAGDGLLVAPFDPAGRYRDSFSIAVRSADGTGQRAAELVYRAGPATAPLALAQAPARARIATLLGVALLSSALGAGVALLATLWYRMLRRPAAPRASATRIGAA
jgi:hypothetical protein